MDVDLSALADDVNDERSFIEFLVALGKDREQSNPAEQATSDSPSGSQGSGWENSTIESFLDAAVAWAAATESGTEYYSRPDNPWTRMAQILHSGKFHE